MICINNSVSSDGFPFMLIGGDNVTISNSYIVMNTFPTLFSIEALTLEIDGLEIR
jgi:hypothetical protein